jgi:hemerythrin
VSTLDFLREWLSQHILGIDMQYKDFLASKGVK